MRNNRLKKPWSYSSGGIGLGFLSLAMVYLTGVFWRITTGFLYIGLGVLEKFGFNPRDWYYFTVYDQALNPGESFFFNDLSLIVIFMILGSLLSVLLGSGFKIKKLKSPSQGFWAILGGLLMGYSARLSFGCNIGAYFTSISSMSLQGYVFGVAMFLGAYIGSKILFKYIL